MKKIIFIVLVTISSLSFAQITKFSIEASYPIPIDKNFVGDNFKGIADVGVKYRIKNLQLINFGLSLNGSLLNYNGSGYFPAYDQNLKFKTNLYIIQPRIFAEFNLKDVTGLRPSVGVGYALFLSNTKFDSQSNISDSTANQSGINAAIGLSYDILKKVYVLASYDYTMLSKLESGVPKTTYNTKVNLLKLGIGIRL